MDTVDKISGYILDATLDSKDTSPELWKHIEEMPLTITESIDPEIRQGTLSEYEDSLLDLIKKYASSPGRSKK